MKQIVLLLVLLWTPGAGASPADTTSTSDRCSLSILTGVDTAWVLVDSLRRGMTPLVLDTLHPGVHLLRLVQKDLASWPGGVITDTLVLKAGEQRTLHYSFARMVTVITDPSGALVHLGDSIAGSTPLVLNIGPGATLQGVIIEKKGYEKAVLAIPPGQSPIARAILQRSLDSPPVESPLMNGSGSGEKIGTRLYSAGALTLVAGISAAYFKIKADNRNASFLATGDPSTRGAAQDLDTAAGISLVAAEIGFALFTYFLLSD